MQFPELAPIKPINLPDLKPIESKKQSLQEWHAAGGGVPKQYKGREHVWHAKVKQFAAGGERQMGAGGLLKGIVKGAQKVLPAAERDANLQKFLEPSKAPMRLYHGTNATEGGKGTEAIRRIKPSKEGSLGSGVYLTPSSAHASGYSGIPNDEAIEMMLRNPLHQDVGLKALNQRNSGNVLPAQEGGNMLPVHAQIRNPLIIEGTHGDPMIEALIKLGMDETNASRMVERAYDQKGYIGKEVESRARAAGYDGLMQYRNGDLSEVVSYNPNAVKSAIGNQGTYDTSSPDLSKAKGGEVKMAGGGDPLDEFSPPRYRSAGRRPESQNDRRAAANMPMDFARGVASGVLGAPGDIESLIRMLPGLDEKTVLPTSEDIEKRLPFKSDTPAGRAAAGLGTLAGGFYMGPGAPIRLVGGLPQAVYKAGKDFSRAAGQPAANVIKPTGGNFLTGRTEKDLKPLKARGPTHRDEALLMGGRFAQMADDPESIRIMAQDAALNKWVDSNLTNYVKKQMGTPDDPVRKLAEEGITHKRGLMDEYPRDAEGIKSERKAAGFPEEGMAQSPMAKAWERASDESLATHRAGDIQDMPEKFAKFTEAERNMGAARASLDRKFAQHIENAGLNDREKASLIRGTPFNEKAKMVGDTDLAKANEEFYALQSPMMSSYIALGRENPYISKLDPETRLYAPFTGDLGFDHIMDVLREDVTAGRIRPDQLNKVSMEQAVRRTYQYDQELAAKMNASRAAAREGLPTYREYPEGYKWIELNKPGSFAQESEAMGHSVRGYEPPKGHPDWSEGSGDSGSSSYGHGGWEAIKSGKAKVYSLVDSKGAPHATVEVGQHNPNLDSRYAKENLPELYAKYSANRNDYFNSWPDFLKKEAPELLEATKSKITQIKGKQNRAPNEEYLPYIQDFVKGGQWSDVGDFRNTGLRDLQRTPKLDEYLKQKGVEVPRYLDEGEYQKYESDFLMDQLYPKNDPQYLPPQTPEGMAKGGAVRMGKGGKSGALVSVAEAVAAASKKADEILDAKKAAGKLEEVMKAKQAPMVAPQGTGLPLMPRSEGMYIPGVKQEDLPRMPRVDKARAEGKSPAYTERMQDLLDSPTARKKVDKLINKGKDLNVLEWYGIEPLRQVAMNAGRTPEQFESLVAQLASASQRNPVDQQNKMGSYLHYLSQTGQLPDDAFLLTNKIKRGKQEMPAGTPIELPPGYGSLAQGDIFGRGKQIASGDIMGALPPDKKLGTFYRNYLGNLKPVTVDVNAVRGPIIERGDPRWLASKLVEKDEEGNVIATHFPRRDVAEGRMSLKEAKDRPGFWEAAPSGSEYAGFEDLWQRGARRHDIEPAEAQALGWYGSADVTALKTKPELYVDNLERMIKRTAEQTGQHPLQVMEDIVRGKGFLYKEGGLVEKRFDGGGMAAADFAGPEDDGGNLDKAKLMAKILAEEAKKQGSKEVGSLSKPRALTDLLNRGVIANNPLSAGVDLFNMGLDAVGLGSKKPFLGSEHVKDLMNKYNVTSGEERPIMETALSFASPTAMIKGAMKAPGAVAKAKEALTSSKIPPLATEAKTAQAGKPTGATYATKQEGPFFRVSPTNLDTSAAKTRGTKEANGLQSAAPLGGGAEQSGREVPKFLSSEEVGRIIADPVANEPLNIAKKYTQDTQGVDFGVPQVPSSSLAKQSGIARTFDLAVQGSPEYKSAIFGAYGREMPDLMEKIGAKNYDDLMEKAYRQMAKETDEQFRRLPYNFSYHRAGEGNYNGAKDMASDVHGNKHLYVYQGGDKHDFLHNVDPQSGLNENEKFRAVHDLLGHAIYGNEFGPKGEEMAWAVHQQMYSPLARMAMTAETRGQNSVVNYSPLNAKLKETIAEYERLGNEALRRGDTKFAKEIAELKKQAYFGFEFAPNKAVLLPPEFMNPRFTGGVPDYLAAANQPTPGTSIQSPLTHFSNKPDLTFTDPRKYGTGIKGAEADRLTNYPGAVRDRSYFYMGEPGTVSPEPGLGVNRYRGEASSLYDITQDPLGFSVLAREANRTPYTAKANQGVTYPLQEANDIERMVKEYGYQGMANPKASKPMAIMFKETPVRRQARGGLSSIK